MIKHSILGNKVHVYKRENSRFWQCSSYLAGRNHRTSTKEESLSLAKQFAEDWYLGMRGKARDGLLVKEKTFEQVAQLFLKEYETITGGERSPKWGEGHSIHLLTKHRERSFIGRGLALKGISSFIQLRYRYVKL